MVPENYNIYVLSGRELRRYFLMAGSMMFFTGYVFYKSILISAIMAALSIAGIPYYRNMLVDKRKSQLRLQFKDMLYSVSSSLTAGRYLSEAIEESERPVSLIHGKLSVMSLEIRNMVRQMNDANSSDEAVLTDLSIRSDIKEIRDFTDVCLTCRKTGGDLSAVIYRSVALITQNIELQKEKETLMIQKKLESRILAAMPVIVTGFVNLTSEDYLEVMYTTFAGRIMMTAAFAGTVISFLWTLKLTYTEGVS